MGLALVPGAAFVEELAGDALQSRRGDEIAHVESVAVGFDEPEQPRLLLLAHRRRGGDDKLGGLQLDQRVDLDAGFAFAGGFAVEHGIAARLHLVGMDGPFRVGVCPLVL